MNSFPIISTKRVPKYRGAITLFLLSVFCFCISFEVVSATDRVSGLPYSDTLSAAPDPVDEAQKFLFKDDSVSCTIPFSKAGSLILIKGRADTIEGNFILDTGAPYLILNVIYFRHYPVTVVPDEHQTSISGTSGMINKTKLKEFTFGALHYFQTEVDLVDLGHIENSKGVKILGLIGFELLQHCEMIIDYENSLIYLHRIGRKEGAKYNSRHLQDHTGYTTIPIEIMDHKIVVRTEMAGRKLQFVMDSGAETNILDSRLPSLFFKYVNITGRLNIRGSDNTTVEALSGNANNIKIGGEDMGSLPVLIANLERTCFWASGCANGVLGFEFLRLRKLGFNFVTGKMYLWK
ncbi:MAG: retropepsin-like domain-containing protein [Flavisolibacter sp.]|nr:retropepsin-like domain-containing protein [Flavisolibacter sp.]